MLNFKELEIIPEIRESLEDLGFENPMPVQEQAIPILLNGDKDFIGLAQTGTGKTAAFGIPILQHIDLQSNKTQALILSPTRELCIQIARDIESFAKHMKGVKVLPVYGGSSIETQIRGLKRGAHVVVATPGRMLDLIRRKQTNFSTVKIAVLDEADEMLNMGFRDELDGILAETPDTKRTWLFSATMPREIKDISSRYMHDPQEITIGTRNTASKNITHMYFVVSNSSRYQILKRIVDYYPGVYGIVFCRTRRSTQEVADNLIQDGYNADALHGDLSQAQRDYVMQKFRRKNLNILVATDVAARGLDVNDLTHVINYELPDEPEIYIHRSGRTGRAMKSGISISLVGPKRRHSISRFEKKAGTRFERGKVPTGNDVCEKQLFDLIDRVEKAEVNEELIEKYLPDIYKKFEGLERDELIKHFVSLEFNRFLNYYKDARDLEIKDSSSFSAAKGKAKGRGGSFAPTRKGDARFFINIGKTDKLTVPKLIGILKEVTRNRNIPIGKIDILKNFSFFEVKQEHTDLLLRSFKKAFYKGRKLNVELSKKPGTKPGKKVRTVKVRKS